MFYDDIRRLPTVVEEIPSGCMGVHESTLRAYQILEKVKWLLQDGTGTAVVLELIDMMEMDANKGRER